jgi:predicted DNA-binding transcriptional regulator YafY
MRRADRLFQIIQLLRRRRVLTAAQLAERLEVSERTIYRDIRDLILSGTPIDGEAGVGYSLRAGFDLPPLMFDEAEAEALLLGARIVASFADDELRRASRSALSKVEAVLPERQLATLARSKLFAPASALQRRASPVLRAVRKAVDQRQKLRLDYADEAGDRSDRVVRPLGAFFWGKIWTLTAWCELRDDFRNFRLDRIQGFEVLAEPFEDEPGRTLRDFLRRYGPEAEQLLE